MRLFKHKRYRNCIYNVHIQRLHQNEIGFTGGIKKKVFLIELETLFFLIVGFRVSVGVG